MSLCGVIFLLIARGHYTIDVILAYFVTTRIWWIYHSLAHNTSLRTRGDHNLIANECWWYAFRSVAVMETEMDPALIMCSLHLQMVRGQDKWSVTQKIQPPIAQNYQTLLCEKMERPPPGQFCVWGDIHVVRRLRLSRDLETNILAVPTKECVHRK